MISLNDAKALLDQDVTMQHWTGVIFEGRLIGICEQPSVIWEDADGVRYTYSIGSLEAISPASRDKEQS